VTDRPAPVARLLEQVSALDRAYSTGHHGRWSASRRAELVDAALCGLFDSIGPPEGVALVALGGYGRGELAPRSDVDLLLLHRGGEPEELAALAERLLYPLWDAGFAVGHGVRTAAECVALAAERLDATTAMLDGRWLAGDEVVWDETHRALVDGLREEPRAFAERLRVDAQARAERFGHVSHLLEPDLKEGGGGLRDAQALGWIAIALGEEPGARSTDTTDAPGALDALGLERSAERRAVNDAYEFLLRVRSALHLETGRRSDRLLLEQQPGIARWMGFADEPGLPAVDGLMRQVFEHARQIEHVRMSVFDRYLRGGSEARAVEATPEGVLLTLAEVARERGVVPPQTLDAIEAARIPEPIAWTDAVRDAFLGLLREGAAGAEMLEVLDRVDLLRRYVPEWALVRCRPQRDPYHRFPVDVHLLRTFAGLAGLLDDPGSDAVSAEAVGLVRDRDGVLLGALLHDIGKTGEGGHVAVGREMAARALGRMRLPTATRDLAHFMVSEHLLLPDTATRRDLEDDDLVHDVASRVGDPEHLAALYLLAVADARATGPAAWTPWRATLIRELVAKVERVLERGEAGPETAVRLAERADALRSLLPDLSEDDLQRFLLRMPRSYLLTVPLEQIAKHVPLIERPLAALDVRTLAGEGARPETHRLTVVAADRPGLLSLIAGALSLTGLSILTAQVFTTEDGAALDVFEVEGAFEAEISEERWREFRTTLRKAIEGRLALDHRVEAKRRYYPPPRHEIPVEVEVHPDASDFFTVVEVGASDRIGLLYDITRTFAELRLDVHLAKVATYGARVVDAFYVRDVLGRKLDAEQAGELERALRARLGS
jgi:[protein-PII] uridylyltransferase